MNQDDRRKYLIEGLLKERPEYENIQIPSDAGEQKMLLRSLMNIRMPGEMDDVFLYVQDAYLIEENRKKGIVTLADMEEVQPDLYIWKGDITTLKVGAIVNAANSGMTGWYQPCHNCIDKAEVEYFNLGVNPIFRETYILGNVSIKEKGYYITESCIGCGTCMKHCPQNCIEKGTPFVIRQEHCLHCGNCYKNCPVKAVIRK